MPRVVLSTVFIRFVSLLLPNFPKGWNYKILIVDHKCLGSAWDELVSVSKSEAPARQGFVLEAMSEYLKVLRVRKELDQLDKASFASCVPS